jgi:O-antigen/teichoic acid export membrane protein
MNFKTKFLKGAAMVGLGQIGLQALLLIRNIFVARLLPPEQFGVAVTFVTILAALDAMSEMGIELFLIRSPESENIQLQSTLHTIMISRAIFSAIVLFLLATPIANLFHTTEVIWAYHTLAIIPLLKGFAHLDYRRFERNLHFFPGLLVNLSATLIGTLTAIFLALETASFSAMLYGNIIQTAGIVLGTHIVARRSYRLSFNTPYIKQLGSFGTPLILNGMVLFLASQGDRVIVGSKLGVRELAIYGIATILTGGVTLLFAKVMGGIFLPAFANVINSTQDFSRRYEICGALTSCAAFTTTIFFGLLGAPFASLLYGSNYTYSPTLFAALGALAGFKIMRNQQQIAFIAFGDTKHALTANIIAVCGILASFFIIIQSASIEAMVLIMTAAEAIALIYSVDKLKLKLADTREYELVFGFALIAASVLSAQYFGWLTNSIQLLTIYSALLILSACAVNLYTSTKTMALVFNFLSRLRNSDK